MGFAIVNQTRSCIPYTQAVLLRGGGQTLRVVAASDIAGVDHTSPYVAWIERIARACAALDATPTQRVLGPQDFDNALQAEWAEMAPAHLLWQPLPVEARDGETIGVLLLRGVMTLPLMLVFAVALGVVAAFDNPSRQAFVSDLVSQENASNAVALNSAFRAAMFFSVLGIGSAAPMLLPGAMMMWRLERAIRAPADQARDVM